jgi:flagellar operon protein
MNTITPLRVTDNAQSLTSPERASTNAASFRNVLSLEFSKHANNRLSDRNIALTGEQMDRVKDGIARAGEKGIRDSLVLVDDIALVVNVRSRTVITALAQQNEHVFSNIDGAVIV